MRGRDFLSRRTALIAACGLIAVSTAAPATVVLTFEGIGDEAEIAYFYDTGTTSDSQGNVGPAYGIAFDPNWPDGSAQGLIDSDAGGTGNFANEPSPDTIMVLREGSDIEPVASVFMNVFPGFDTGLSFFYANGAGAGVGPGTVAVYDGFDGFGNLLGSLTLSANNDTGNPDCSGDPTGVFCNWTPMGMTFSGTAHSVLFTGPVRLIGFDDVTLGSATPGGAGAVPEPSSWAMMLLGFGAIGFAMRRRRKGKPLLA